MPGVAGTWKDLTDTVNVMAANLTEQVRGIVKVVTAVANGDLKQALTVKSKGSGGTRRDDQQHDRYARHLRRPGDDGGARGGRGGPARRPGQRAGRRGHMEKDLTGNVSLLAANLTNEVRAIAEVATAVTTGDLTRSIQVDARGEVAELKDYINTMIDNLRLTTGATPSRTGSRRTSPVPACCKGQRDLATVGSTLLSELVPIVGAHQGMIYQMDAEAAPRRELLAKYADDERNGYPARLELGQGFIGQCALDRRRILVSEVPPDTIRIGASLIDAVPRSVIVLPVIFEDQVKAVIALASLHEFDAAHLTFLEQLTASIGIVLNSIEVTMRTEGLLKQSQQLATELTAQQRELQQTNEQLELKAQQLAERNVEVERKNQEIEHARRALEEGDRTRADLQVQVRVPGQHEPRAAHAAQQHPRCSASSSATTPTPT